MQRGTERQRRFCRQTSGRHLPRGRDLDKVLLRSCLEVLRIGQGPQDEM
jgi:hypothetical protein